MDNIERLGALVILKGIIESLEKTETSEEVCVKSKEIVLKLLREDLEELGEAMAREFEEDMQKLADAVKESIENDT